MGYLTGAFASLALGGFLTSCAGQGQTPQTEKEIMVEVTTADAVVTPPTTSTRCYPMSEWKLRRTQQCTTCPWLKGSSLEDIPGYDPGRHRGLEATIAEPGSLALSETAMACHHSPEGKDQYCIGWLVNQLGEGNNIGMRAKMLTCTNGSDIKLAGLQKANFRETLSNG